MNPDQLIQWLGKLYGFPGYVLVALLCIAVCYVFRAMRNFPNESIPAICIILGGTFNLLLAEPLPKDMTLLRWRATNIVIGVVVGILAWALHKTVISKIEDRLPFLKTPDDNKTPTPIPQPEPIKPAGTGDLTKP